MIKNRLVVRIKRSYWHDERGVHQKTDVGYLKRKSEGYNVLEEDCQNIGAEEVFPRIINLSDSPDGIYELAACNISRDWETGCVDEWDYKLSPYEEQEK
tara:strand:- start:251 stop:547 length:297 start_codon:yes stop_codon:yes gene_type:complete